MIKGIRLALAIPFAITGTILLLISGLIYDFNIIKDLRKHEEF